MNSKKLLIVVDMQNDFVDCALGSKEATKIIDNVVNKIKLERAKGSDILFTFDTHNDDYLTTEEGKHLPVEHCILNTNGWKLNEKVNEVVDANDSIICKYTFGSLQLGIDLANMENKYEEIELIGLCTDICVISNAVIAKAALPNAHIMVDVSCCAGVNPEQHDTAISQMKVLQIEILNEGKEPWRN